MWTYIMMTIFMITPALLLDRIKNVKSVSSWQKSVKICLSFFMFLPMYMINAFMYNTGNDYGNYKYAYENIYAKGLPSRFEKGFSLVNRIFLSFDLDFQWLLIVLCLIAYGMFFAFIMKHSCNIAYSLLLYVVSGYFFLLGMNMLRTFVAISISLLSFKYIIEKKLIPFVCIIILASTFHISALIMLPFYFLLNHDFKLSFYTILAGIAFWVYFFVLKVLSLIAPEGYYGYYLIELQKLGFSFDLLYNLGIFFSVAVVFWYHRDGYVDNQDRVLSNAAIWSLVMALLIPWFPEYRRFIQYLMIPFFAYITVLIQKEPNKVKRWTIYAVLALVFFIPTSYRIGNWGVIPYQSIFSR